MYICSIKTWSAERSFFKLRQSLSFLSKASKNKHIMSQDLNLTDSNYPQIKLQHNIKRN